MLLQKLSERLPYKGRESLMKFTNIITSDEAFEAFCEEVGKPSELAANKVISSIDAHCEAFIKKSPFLTMASANKDGACDVTPRGDDPGFVHVVDENFLFIPERPGNKRMDSAHNILSNPHVGLLFFIPGLGETLRINGKAHICRDPELLDACMAKGKRPLFGVLVEVKECYIHCAKAFLRSGLWKPESWIDQEERPSVAKMIKAHTEFDKKTEQDIERSLEESYAKRLY